MKTLDQVEARIPVSESTTPPSGDHQFTITQPGSYYLTGNVVVTKPSGIAIAATGVTLDLNGFSIRREAGNSGAGVEVFSARCAIMNGSIGGFGTGIAGTAALGGSVSRVRVSECGTGIFVGTAWRVEESTVVGSASNGLFLGNDGVVRGCTILANLNFGVQTGPGGRISHCTVSKNVGGGVVASVSATVENTTAESSDGDGISVALAAWCAIASQTAMGIRRSRKAPGSWPALALSSLVAPQTRTATTASRSPEIQS